MVYSKICLIRQFSKKKKKKTFRKHWSCKTIQVSKYKFKKILLFLIMVKMKPLYIFFELLYDLNYQFQLYNNMWMNCKTQIFVPSLKNIIFGLISPCLLKFLLYKIGGYFVYLFPYKNVMIYLTTRSLMPGKRTKRETIKSCISFNNTWKSFYLMGLAPN